MRIKNKVSTGLLTLGLCAGGMFGAAQAAVIGAAPNADFMNGAYTLSLASGAASYTFSQTGDDGADTALAVQTGGTGTINSLFGAPAAYFTASGGPFIDSSLLGSFESYATPAAIPFSNTDSFYALGLTLADGFHYGYARVDATTATPSLLSYGYQSVAGQGIQAGAPATAAPGGGQNTPVPEPTTLAMFGLGLALLGFGATRRARRND